MRNGSICWNMGKTQKEGPSKVEEYEIVKKFSKFEANGGKPN